MKSSDIRKQAESAQSSKLHKLGAQGSLSQARKGQSQAIAAAKKYATGGYVGGGTVDGGSAKKSTSKPGKSKGKGGKGATVNIVIAGKGGGPDAGGPPMPPDAGPPMPLPPGGPGGPPGAGPGGPPMPMRAKGGPVKMKTADLTKAEAAPAVGKSAAPAAPAAGGFKPFMKKAPPFKKGGKC